MSGQFKYIWAIESVEAHAPVKASPTFHRATLDHFLEVAKFKQVDISLIGMAFSPQCG